VLLIAVSSGFSTFCGIFRQRNGRKNYFPDSQNGKQKHTVRHAHKKNPAKQDSPPAAGRASDILPFRCSAIRAEHFLSYGNEVSYTIRKQADAHF